MRDDNVNGCLCEVFFRASCQHGGDVRCAQFGRLLDAPFQVIELEDRKQQLYR